MDRTTYATQEFFMPGHLSKMMISANVETKFLKDFFEKVFPDKFYGKSVIFKAIK